jgi:putative transposase
MADPQNHKTRRAWDEPGHAHFLTYSCLHRWPLLNRERSRRWVIEALEHTRAHLHVQLWAYVIMPEHVHVLVWPHSDAPVRRILANLKHPVAKAAHGFLNDTKNQEWLERLTVRYPSRAVFRFWEPGGGFDHNLWQHRSLKAVIDYIHANPVRRGLVENPLDWEWSSARFWDDRTDVPIRMDAIES